MTTIDPSDLEGIISDKEAVDRSEREAKVWEIINDLPDRCREVFLMSKRDGMTYNEIAEELGISVKTVEHQISKALKKLRNDKDLQFVLIFF
jgi:RNA polymerase sigma-70 factor (ECF subfamily)